MSRSSIAKNKVLAIVHSIAQLVDYRFPPRGRAPMRRSSVVLCHTELLAFDGHSDDDSDAMVMSDSVRAVIMGGVSFAYCTLTRSGVECL